MTSPHFVFRSKREQEQEKELLKKYRQIGIAAIAAASSVGRPDAKAAAQPNLRLANARD